VDHSGRSTDFTLHFGWMVLLLGATTTGGTTTPSASTVITAINRFCDDRSRPSRPGNRACPLANPSHCPYALYPEDAVAADSLVLWHCLEGSHADSLTVTSQRGNEANSSGDFSIVSLVVFLIVFASLTNLCLRFVRKMRQPNWRRQRALPPPTSDRPVAASSVPVPTATAVPVATSVAVATVVQRQGAGGGSPAAEAETGTGVTVTSNPVAVGGFGAAMSATFEVEEDDAAAAAEIHARAQPVSDTQLRFRPEPEPEPKPRARAAMAAVEDDDMDVLSAGTLSREGVSSSAACVHTPSFHRYLSGLQLLYAGARSVCRFSHRATH
jgi:hypothetical protein